MKKLINNVEDIVREMLEGIVKINPNNIEKLPNFNIIKRKEIKNKVNLISGGGSGHEPAHAGYVGYGMLDAAVAGEVFTAPSPDQILEAMKSVKSEKGILLIIKNYSGDIMNFEMAAEMAEIEGIKVAKVIVDDDIAMENSTYTLGKRGVAGTVFVHKITGAAAEKGLDLEEVKRISEKAIKNVKTLGMSLGPSIVPASGKPSFSLEEDEIEMGLGIHGEPGTHKEKLKKVDEHVEYMMNEILDKHKLNPKDKAAVMINGLGATPLIELYIINRKVAEILENKNIEVLENLVGNYMTSLEMPGFSITILKLDEELEEYISFKAETAAYKK